MFFRTSGRQCLLLASYRDAQGRVRQRRLGAFRDAASLDQLLGQLAPPQRRDDLRAKALALLAQLPRPKSTVQHTTRRTAKALLNLLSRQPELENSQEVQLLRERLQSPSTSQHERLRLSPRRRYYWSQDVAVQAYAQTLDREALALEQRGQLQASLELYQQRLAHIRGDRAPLQAARLLHQLGRSHEARQLVVHMPPGDPWREYHLATLHWQLHDQEQAMRHFDRALTLAPDIAEALAKGAHPYWQAHLELWDLPSRRVLADLARLPVLRGARWRAAQQGRRPRRLIPEVARGWLLDRAQRIASGFDPGRRRGRLDTPV